MIVLPAMALSAMAAQVQAAGATAQAAPKTPVVKDVKPNVVLFMCDQLSAMALPLYGNNFIKTPNIDRLSREGITFMNSICVVPYSSPARASLITGLYPNVHGIIDNVDNSDVKGLDPKFPSTEIILGAHGYATGHFGKWHLGQITDYPPYKGDSTEFASYKDMFDGLRREYAEQRAKNNPSPAPARPGEVLTDAGYDEGYGFYQTEYMHDKSDNRPEGIKKLISSIGRQGVPVDLADYSLVVRDGIDFIRANRDKPFMATISLLPPHAPFCIFDPYYNMVDPAKIPLSPTAWDTDPKTNYYTDSRDFKTGQYLDETGMRERMRCYYGEILYVDAMLGRVLDALDQLKLTGKTIVVFTTDHGDLLASHGLLYGKVIDGFTEELTRTPLVIRLPGDAHAGRKVQATFNSMDLAPTLLALTGQAVPASMQGHSFVPVIEGKAKDEVGFGYSMRMFARQLRGEVNGKIYAYSKVFKDPDATREELYNVTDDPYQQKDLINDPAYAPVVATMRATFDKFADKYGDWHIEDMPAKGLYNLGNSHRPGKSDDSATAPAGRKGARNRPAGSDESDE